MDDTPHGVPSHPTLGCSGTLIGPTYRGEGGIVTLSPHLFIS